jgi:hypothetical protein
MRQTMPPPPAVWATWCRVCGCPGIAARSKREAEQSRTCPLCPVYEGPKTMGVARYELVPARKGK